MLSTHSFNALLKTLEEPPPHVKFLLATTDPQKLPVTVLSRCLQFNLKRLSANLIGERLKYILRPRSSTFEPAARRAARARGRRQHARRTVAARSTASPSAAASADEADARAMLGTIERGHVAPDRRAAGAAATARRCCAGGASSTRMRPTTTGRCSSSRRSCSGSRSCRSCPRPPPRMSCTIERSSTRLAKALGPEDVQLYYQIALAGRRDLRMAPDPRLGFEMTLLRMLAFRPGGCRAGVGRSGGRRTAARPYRRHRRGCARSNGDRACALRGRAAGCGLAAGRRVAAEGDLDPRRISSMPRWLAVVGPQLSAAWCDSSRALRAGSYARRAGASGLDPPRTPALRKRASRISSRRRLSRYLGRDVRLGIRECRTASHTPAHGSARRPTQERTLRARAAFEADPAVKGLKERFGASVLPTRCAR